jgi:hypothetical protein
MIPGIKLSDDAGHNFTLCAIKLQYVHTNLLVHAAFLQVNSIDISTLKKEAAGSSETLVSTRLQGISQPTIILPPIIALILQIKQSTSISHSSHYHVNTAFHVCRMLGTQSLSNVGRSCLMS